MQSRMLPALLLSFLSATLLLPGAAIGGAAGEELQSLREITANLRRLRDSRAAELQFAAGEACLQIRLRGAFDGKDCEVLLRYDGRQVGEGRALAPDWAPLAYHADGRGLSWDGRRLSGELRIDLVPWLASQEDHHPDKGQLRPQHWQLQIDADKGGSAEYRSGGYASPGSIAAKVTVLALRRPDFPPAPSSQAVLGLPVLRVAHADLLAVWHDLQLVAVIDALRLPQEIAAAQLPRHQWHWPEPQAEVKAKPAKSPKASKPPRSAPRPSALGAGRGGLDDELDLGEALEGQLETMLIDPAQLAAVATSMRRHAEAIRAAAEALAKPGEPAAVPIGTVDSGDPDFVAATCSRPLPVSDSGELVLPESFGSSGHADWAHPERWQILGPVPPLVWEPALLQLPAIIAPEGAELELEMEKLGGSYRSPFYGATRRDWQWMPSRIDDGRVTPPIACKPNYTMYGLEWSGFYHRLHLRAPQAGTLWASLLTTRAATVWLNGQRLWQSAATSDDPQCRARRYLLSLPLRAGMNELIYRNDISERPAFSGMSFCISGGPRPAAEAQAAFQARLAAMQKIDDPMAGTRQFRANHDGRFPDADPPLAWDFASGTNIAWLSRLGNSKGASVLVIDDQLLVTTEEPNLIVALDPQTGSVLWRRHLDQMEYVDPEVWKQAAPLWAEAHSLDYNKPADAPRRQELYAQLQALYPDKWRPGVSLKAESGVSGTAMTTPASDGKRIFVSGQGLLLACFDRAGERLWQVETGGRGSSMGTGVCSPVLAAQGVIMQIPDYGSESSFQAAVVDERGVWQEEKMSRRYALRCFDPADGSIRWTSRRFRLAHFGGRYDADGVVTPRLLRLSDGKQTMDVVITGTGHVFRAEDGVLLLHQHGSMSRAPNPIRLGPGQICIMSDVDYHKDGGVVACLELCMLDRDTVVAKTVWQSRQHMAARYSGHVEHRGVLHAINSKFEGVLWTLDADNGEILGAQHRLSRHGVGRVYVSATIAGELTVFGDDGANSFNKRLPQRLGWDAITEDMWNPGNMTTILAGRQPLVLARNGLLPRQGIKFDPAAYGDSWYLRLPSGVARLRVAGDGAGYQAAEVVRTLLAGLPGCAAEASEPLTGAEPRSSIAEADHGYDHSWHEGEVPYRWSMLGPIPAAAAADIGKRLQLTSPRLKFLNDAGKSGAVGDITFVPAADDDRHMPSRLCSDDFRYGLRFERPRAHAGEPDSRCYWFTSLWIDRHRTLRWDSPGAGTRAWIGGVEVLHGQRIFLPRGEYQISVETTAVDQAPEILAPRLWQSDDLGAERAQRAELRQQLQRVLPKLQKDLEPALASRLQERLRLLGE